MAIKISSSSLPILCVLAGSLLRAQCTAGGPGQWTVHDTGDPDYNGVVLANCLDPKALNPYLGGPPAYACGDTITLDPVTYRDPMVFSGLASDSLNGNIDASATAITTNGTSARLGYIQIDSEKMKVTAGAGTSTPTVVRGVLGTAAAPHNSGASVQILDAPRPFTLPHQTGCGANNTVIQSANAVSVTSKPDRADIPNMATLQAVAGYTGIMGSQSAAVLTTDLSGGCAALANNFTLRGINFTSDPAMGPAGSYVNVGLVGFHCPSVAPVTSQVSNIEFDHDLFASGRYESCGALVNATTINCLVDESFIAMSIEGTNYNIHDSASREWAAGFSPNGAFYPWKTTDGITCTQAKPAICSATGLSTNLGLSVPNQCTYIGIEWTAGTPGPWSDLAGFKLGCYNDANSVSIHAGYADNPWTFGTSFSMMSNDVPYDAGCRPAFPGTIKIAGPLRPVGSDAANEALIPSGTKGLILKDVFLGGAWPMFVGGGSYPSATAFPSVSTSAGGTSYNLTLTGETNLTPDGRVPRVGDYITSLADPLACQYPQRSSWSAPAGTACQGFSAGCSYRRVGKILSGSYPNYTEGAWGEDGIDCPRATYGFASSGNHPPFTVTSSTNTLLVSIDGGAPVSITLNTGTRTAAQVAADITSALGSAGAGGVTQDNNGNQGVVIKSNSSGSNSSVQILNPPSNSANGALGLTPATYQTYAYWIGGQGLSNAAFIRTTFFSDRNLPVGGKPPEFKSGDAILADGFTLGGNSGVIQDSQNQCSGYPGDTWSQGGISLAVCPWATVKNTVWQNGTAGYTTTVAGGGCTAGPTVTGGSFDLFFTLGNGQDSTAPQTGNKVDNFLTSTRIIGDVYKSPLATNSGINATYSHITAMADVTSPAKWAFWPIPPVGCLLSNGSIMPNGYKNMNIVYTNSIFSVGFGPFGLDTSNGDTNCNPNEVANVNNDLMVADCPASQGQQGICTQANAQSPVSQVDASGISNFWTGVGNAAVNTAASVHFTGPCDVSHPANCILQGSSPGRGTASDGKDKGADIQRIMDRQRGWSEAAGLLILDMAGPSVINNPAAFNIGATHAAISFRIFSPLSACQLHLYTDPARITESAETSGNYQCSRTGNLLQGGVVTFVLNNLSAGRLYAYSITDGSRVMVGQFSTPAADSTDPIGFQLSDSHAVDARIESAPSADMSNSTQSAPAPFTAGVATPSTALSGLRYYRWIKRDSTAKVIDQGPVSVAIRP